MTKLRLLMLHALLALAAGAASAQSDARPDPLDPRAWVPAVDYRSTLTTYLPYRDPSLASWREMNEQVGRLGGHVGHTDAGRTGAGKASIPAAKPAAGSPKPPSSGHGSHR